MRLKSKAELAREYAGNPEGAIAYAFQLQEQLAQAQALIGELKQQIFGSKSEQLTPEQEKELAAVAGDVQDQNKQLASLTQEVLEEALEQEKEERRKRDREKRRQRRHLPPVELQKEQVVLEPENKFCPHTGQPRPEIGREVTTEYDFVPAQLIIRETIRPKYGACGKDCCPGVAKRIGCLGHARRRFYKALLEKSLAALWFIAQIRALYKIERELKNRTPEERRNERLKRAPAIWLSLKRRAEEMKKEPRFLPQSTIGKAVNYFLNEYTALVGYLREGRFLIDNNLVENDVRPAAVGRRRWLFIGHPDAGWRSAVIYTLIQSCRRRGINTQEYLTDVLRRLPAMTSSEVVNLVPSRWIPQPPPAA